jgi:antitoxin (DNA-binding transcriptional repressor) of toxin-antitoxin stability system
VGYSSENPDEIRTQIRKAKDMGISGFVVDWYGDREPSIDQSYATMQKLAAQNKFQIAMMYDETNQEDGATDEAIADFTMFHDSYLSAQAAGHEAYLTYDGRPVIFIFPHGSSHTDWDKVRAVVNKWSPAPLLIEENLPGQYADAFDGFYPWIHPGPKGWAPDGSSWGEEYLSDFYQTMGAKFPDKIIVGGAWPQFDDSKASWSLNRHISARCGQTFLDTFNMWHKFFPTGQVIPFMLVETWNDYEEGSEIEPGLPTCASQPAQNPMKPDTLAAASFRRRIIDPPLARVEPSISLP